MNINPHALLATITDAIGQLTGCCMPSPTLYINRRTFKVIKLLGEGGFSFVYLVQDVATGRLYALKKIRCPFGSEGVQDAMKEAEMYRTFQHENVIKVMDTCVVSDKDGSKIVYIFLPYYKRGNLLDAISANLLHHTHFSEPDMLRFFRGICYGVRALHCHRLPNVPISSREDEDASNSGIEAWDSRDGRASMVRQGSSLSFVGSENGTSLANMNRISTNDNGLGPAQDNDAVIVPFAHRDIKPANVLIADDGQTPVLMDFGSMARARIKIQTRQQALYEQDVAAEKSSMPYRAPELFDVKTGSTLDEKVDIWSLGCTLYAMAYGTSPFETNQINQGGSIALAVLNGTVRFPTVDQADRYSSELRDLIKAMLVVDPAMRLDIHEVIERVDLLLNRPHTRRPSLSRSDIMNRTQAALHALPSGLINRLCRSKATRLSLKQMYTFGRHVLESKNRSALAIPAVFLHQELPIRLSHALKLLTSNSLPVNMADMPNFQSIFASYLEDISMITQMPKPSTPQLEEEFTALLRNLEQRHKIKILAISKGFKELMDNIQRQCVEQDLGHSTLFYRSEKGWTIDPQADKAIQTFFNRFYTINLGTRLLIGEHLALHDRGLNLVQRVNPLAISKRAIRDAQTVCAAHYGQSAPSVLIHTPNPDISTTYVDEFLHRNIYELLKNAMRATCETHLNNGSPISLGLSSTTASRSKLPPVKLVLVDGGEDVTIKISDEGGGMALSDMDKIWSYVHSWDSSSLRQSSKNVAAKQQELSKTATRPHSSRTISSNVDSMTVMGGLASEAKDYLDLPLNASGHGLPLARLIARYFGGDLSLISMEGYGTDSYLSLYRDDDHLENFPEVDEEMAVEIDVFINEFMDEPTSLSSHNNTGYEHINSMDQQQQPELASSLRK
ncbi:hypothetical protein FBU30_004440 [Linnemannia zychae]|nr:hypothetical protein FBU30_004440 [Linnemannia zychae]